MPISNEDYKKYLPRRIGQNRCVRGAGFFMDALDSTIERYAQDDNVAGMIIDMEIALERLKKERDDYGRYSTT